MTEQEKKEIALREKEEIRAENGEATRPGITYSPTVDIFETDEAITVLADMPGVAADGIDIDVKDGVLTITGTVQEMESRFEPVYREYGVGGYQRRFTLGDKVDATKISAKLVNGVLNIDLPKADRMRPRRIQVATA